MGENGVTEMKMNSLASDCLLAVCLSMGVSIAIVSIPLIVGKIQGTNIDDIKPLPTPVVVCLGLACGMAIGFLI